MAQLCTLMGIRHSPLTAYSPWTNGACRSTKPKSWYSSLDGALQVHMYAYAHTSQPLSELNVSPHEIGFHTQPRIPLTFDLNLFETRPKRVFHNIAPNCLNTHIMVKRI